MENGLGVPQSIVLFGANSDIGRAILDEIVRPGVSQVILCARNIKTVDGYAAVLRSRVTGLRVTCIEFDALQPNTFKGIISEISSLVGDIDVVVMAQGLHGDEASMAKQPTSALDLLTVNFSSAIVLALEISQRFRLQSHGRLVVLSSVAGQRVRKTLAVYGASKAGLDQFLLALDHDLRGHGSSVLVVRPGFVSTKMTTGHPKAPFSTHPEKVAKAVREAIEKNKAVVWCPGLLRYLFGALKLLPEKAWRIVVEKQAS